MTKVAIGEERVNIRYFQGLIITLLKNIQIIKIMIIIKVHTHCLPCHIGNMSVPPCHTGYEFHNHF